MKTGSIMSNFGFFLFHLGGLPLLKILSSGNFTFISKNRILFYAFTVGFSLLPFFLG